MKHTHTKHPVKKKSFLSRYTHHIRVLLIFTGFLMAFFLFRNEFFHTYILHLGTYGYIGAFLGGLLYVSSYTIGLGAVLLIFLSQEMSIWELTLFAGLGEILGDVILFLFIRKELVKELKYFTKHNKRLSLKKTSFMSRWVLPTVGAILVASPLPDELGIGLMGISHLKFRYFILIVGILDLVGLFIFLNAVYLFT